MKKETRWSIDQSHTEIAFKVRHMMISHVNGTFKTFDASIYTTEKDFTTAEIDIWIDPNSLSTGDDKRDAHLKGPEFLDVAHHKQITFTSDTIGKADANGSHELWGELTIKGVARNIKLDVVFGGLAKDYMGNEKAGFTVTGKINRTDWGLTWNAAIEAGSVMIGEDVTITCDVELTNLGKKDATMVLEGANNKDGVA